MVTLQSGLLSIFLLIANSLGAPQQRQDVSRSQDPLNCNDLDVYGFHCVPIFQCSNEGIIKTDARGLFDPRYFDNLLLMFGEKYYNSAGQRGTTAGTTTTRTGSAAHRRDRRRWAAHARPPSTSAASTRTAQSSTCLPTSIVLDVHLSVVLLGQRLGHLNMRRRLTTKSAVLTSADFLETAAVKKNRKLAQKKTSCLGSVKTRGWPE